MATRVQRLPKHLRKNLVVLVFARNPSYIQVKQPEEITELVIDCPTGRWQSRGHYLAIGEDNGGQLGRVIGVYDKTKIDHLGNIVRVVESNIASKPTSSISMTIETLSNK